MDEGNNDVMGKSDVSKAKLHPFLSLQKRRIWYKYAKQAGKEGYFLHIYSQYSVFIYIFELTKCKHFKSKSVYS